MNCKEEEEEEEEVNWGREGDKNSEKMMRMKTAITRLLNGKWS